LNSLVWVLLNCSSSFIRMKLYIRLLEKLTNRVVR